ncbi:MAG: hypothetical protein GY714_24890, partial [Desulfobacterales bacterium]|nr:hypothetical protein [Desulfobacterales bacterium]
MDDRELSSTRAKKIREQVSDERWERLVADALGRLEVQQLVVEEHETTGQSLRSCLKTLFPEVPWPTFVNWKRKHANRRGPAWERLL